MNGIIEWANINSGFMDLVFGLLTFVISFIAIIVSIKTARLPYKKKLLLSYGTIVGNITNNQLQTGVSVGAVNVGNRDISVITLGIKNGDTILINKNTIKEIQKIVKPSEIIEQYFIIEELKSSINMNKESYIYVKDTEGKIYTKKIKNLNDFLKKVK